MSSDNVPPPRKAESPRVNTQAKENRGNFVADPQFESLAASEDFSKAPMPIDNVEDEYDQLFSGGNENQSSPRF